MMDIECEVQFPLVSSVRKHNGEVPGNVTSYLDACTKSGVWVAGYHWVRAVAHLYQVCLVIVIHGFPCVYAFGNTSQVQLFLYKRDVETHYDALPHRGSSEGHTAESALPVGHVLSDTEVVYTTTTRPSVAPIGPLVQASEESLANQVGENIVLLSSDSEGSGNDSDVYTLAREFHTRYVASWPLCLRLAHILKENGFPDLESLRELSRDVRQEVLVSLKLFAPLQILRIHAIFQEHQEMQPSSASESHETQIATAHSVTLTKRFTRSSLALKRNHDQVDQPRVHRGSSEGHTAESALQVGHALSDTEVVYTTVTPAVPPINPTAAPSTDPSDSEVVPGSQIKSNSRDECKKEVYRLFRMRGHTPIQRNSREGYLYIKCESCHARCAVSRNVGRGWKVTVCSSELNAQCVSASFAMSEPLSTCDLCGDDQVTEREAVRCNAKHTLCSACFDNSINTILINANDKKIFMVTPMPWCIPVSCFIAV